MRLEELVAARAAAGKIPVTHSMGITLAAGFLRVGRATALRTLRLAALTLALAVSP